MPTYRYDAYNSAGARESGTLDADSERHALQQLKSRGLITRQVRELPPRARRRATVAEIATVTRRLATLVSSSVPLYEALGSLCEQEAALRPVLVRVRDRVAEGAPLSRALAAEPRLFGDSYVNMVAAGEASGALDAVLESLADYLEEQEQVRGRVVSALAYPILMVLVGGGVMVFLLTVVIPRITKIFEESKAALPLLTVALIRLSHLLRDWWWLLAAIGIAAVWLARRALRREEVRCRRDSLLLRLPLLGPMLRRLILARFGRVLGLLLASGVPIIRALEITGEALANRAYRTVLRNVADEIAQGGSLSAGLSRSPLFPPLIVHLTGTGERSGNLEAMLTKAGGAYDREFNAALTRVMGLLEPLLVLAMGLAVGTVVLAVLLPIFEMNQLVK